MDTILFSITGLVILSWNGWFPNVKFGIFGDILADFGHKSVTLGQVKTPGNYDIGDRKSCQNKIHLHLFYN